MVDYSRMEAVELLRKLRRRHVGLRHLAGNVFEQFDETDEHLLYTEVYRQQFHVSRPVTVRNRRRSSLSLPWRTPVRLSGPPVAAFRLRMEADSDFWGPVPGPPLLSRGPGRLMAEGGVVAPRHANYNKMATNHRRKFPDRHPVCLRSRPFDLEALQCALDYLKDQNWRPCDIDNRHPEYVVLLNLLVQKETGSHVCYDGKIENCPHSNIISCLRLRHSDHMELVPCPASMRMGPLTRLYYKHVVCTPYSTIPFMTLIIVMLVCGPLFILVWFNAMVHLAAIR